MKEQPLSWKKYLAIQSMKFTTVSFLYAEMIRKTAFAYSGEVIRITSIIW